MKDPLRYYIAEGLVTLLYWPSPYRFEPNQQAFRAKFFFDPRVNITSKNGTPTELPTVTIDGVTYSICDDFYLDYGTLAADAADAAIMGSIANADRANISYEFAVMVPELVEAPYAY